MWFGSSAEPHIDALNISIYDAGMRTTIDLDPDVDARLRALARERGVPLRTVINDALRAGTQPAARDAPPYTLPSRRPRIRPRRKLDNAPPPAGARADGGMLRNLSFLQ